MLTTLSMWWMPVTSSWSPGRSRPWAHGLGEAFVQNVVHQRAFAAARHTGYATQQSEGELHVDALEVVFAGAGDGDGQAVAGATFFGDGDAFATAEVGAGERIDVIHDGGDVAGGHDFATVFAGSRPQIHDIVGGAHHGVVRAQQQ